MKKFATIGLGFIFPRHKEAIERAGCRLVAAADIDERTKKRLPEGVKFFQDYKEIFNEELDYVSILTPNHLHLEMIKSCLKHSKSVLVEKPPVINKDQLKELLEYENIDKVKVVLQLRYHPKVVELRNKLKRADIKSARLVVKVKRDRGYWDSWKGDEGRSGGILYNIGIHYFDLLVFLLGDSFTVVSGEYREKKAFGEILFGNTRVVYDLEIMDTNDEQTRLLEIDGEEIQLSNQDNLSYEDLHAKVYDEMLAGRGVPVAECKNVVLLVDALKKKN